MTDDTAFTEPVLRLTDPTLAMVLKLRAEEPNASELALWIEVTGTGGLEFTYDMYFAPLSDASDLAAVVHHDELSVVIPADSVDRIRGATLDLNPDPAVGGMVIRNPNRPPRRMIPLSATGAPPMGAASPAMGAAPADLTGDVAQRVIQVLDQQINPSIASHGGRADLVAVEDGAAFLRLSGGCAGCGMATVTLSQGIEVAIRDAVPEIARVVDVTDHASGTNPYYEAAKK
jgi:Fe/S biogenesis protein NfuA